MPSHYQGKVISHAQGIRFKKLREEGVLLDLESGNYFSLNPAGLFIWKACEVPQPFEELSCGLADKFSLTLEQATQDVGIFLKHLQGLRLIEVKDCSVPGPP